MQIFTQQIRGAYFTTITFPQGETVALEITVSSDGQAINLTGFTLKMTIQNLIALSTSSGITITSAVNGQFTVNLSDAATEALTPGSYPYDCWMISGGGVATPLLTGSVVVNPSVTPIP